MRALWLAVALAASGLAPGCEDTGPDEGVSNTDLENDPDQVVETRGGIEREGHDTPRGETRRNQLSDTDVEVAVLRDLVSDPGVDAHNVDVEVHEGVVTLSGSVDDLLARQRAVERARLVLGVRSVIDRLEVRPADRSDQAILVDLREALRDDPIANAAELTATVDDGVVTLSGTVDSWQEKQIALRTATGVAGARAVDDAIDVAPPGERPDDEIAAEIERRLLWDAQVDAGLVDVAVEDGQVTLSGKVGSAAERVRVAADAWVAGVTGVDDTGLEVDPWLRDDMRRSVEERAELTDEQIAQAVRDAFVYDPRIEETPTVAVEDGVVTLTGRVGNLQAKRSAAEDARHTSGVYRVVNLLRVRPAEPLDDDTLADRVRAALRRNPVVDAEAVNVIVDNGEVILSGEVGAWNERRAAEVAAASVAGVVELDDRLVVRRRLEPTIAWQLEQDLEQALRYNPFVDLEDVEVEVDDGAAVLRGTVDDIRAYDALIGEAHDLGIHRIVETDLHIGGAPAYLSPPEAPAG